MSTIHLHRTTTSTPEQYVAGLTDFGPGRSKLFGNIPQLGSTQLVPLVVDAQVLDPRSGTDMRAGTEFEQRLR